MDAKCICGCLESFHGTDYCASSNCGGECEGFNIPTTNLDVWARIRKEQIQK